MTAPPGVPACRNTANPEMFCSTDVHIHEKAKTYCERCPVVEWCLEERERIRDEAKAGGTPTGTWGGRLWLDNGQPVDIEHGTARGDNQHRYRNQEPCKPCHYAHLAHERAKRVAKRDAQAAPFGEPRSLSRTLDKAAMANA